MKRDLEEEQSRRLKHERIAEELAQEGLSEDDVEAVLAAWRKKSGAAKKNRPRK
jgi:hypothetical protein